MAKHSLYRVDREMSFSNIIDSELNKRFRMFYAEVDTANSSLSTLVCFNMGFHTNRKKSGLINHFKSAELESACSFWLEMELESERIQGYPFDDWNLIFCCKMKPYVKMIEAKWEICFKLNMENNPESVAKAKALARKFQMKMESDNTTWLNGKQCGTY